MITPSERSFRVLIALLLLATCAAGRAAGEETNKVIAGWVERVALPDANGAVVTAKLDTGARTSSIHAINIESFKRKGRSWVRFDLVIDDDRQRKTHHLERRLRRSVRIKEHEGHHSRRPVVELDFCFNGRTHRTQFTLADRSNFLYPVLLGRRFLRGVAVVDPERTFLLPRGCDPTPAPGKPTD